REDGLPLVDAPAEIRQSEPARQDVDLLPGVLPNVRDEQVACQAVEREPPRIPHAVDRVRPAAAFVPQDLAERTRECLCPVAGIPAGAAVAQADVEQPVGPELELAAVVVGVWLLDEEQPA